MASKGRGNKPDIKTLNLPELHQIVEKSETTPLDEAQRGQLKTLLDVVEAWITPVPRNSEKLSKLIGAKRKTEDEPESAPGHGRRPASAYEGAQQVAVPHADLQSGAHCPDPECRGKVYRLKAESKNGERRLVRIVALQPFQGTVYHCERLRCNICEKVYTAPPPDGVGDEKYDETVSSMIGLFKYGLGIPFNRMEALQAFLGVPMPASVQWELVEDAAELIKPVHEALMDEAAQGDTLHTDDTSARILQVCRDADDKRTGLHTTGVVSVLEEGRRFIALYRTGTKHAGENIRDVLALRRQHKASPILMCDALSWNTSKLKPGQGVDKLKPGQGVDIVLGNCLAHGRRHVAEVYSSFPLPCLHILEELGKVYLLDEQAKEKNLGPRERLKFHQEFSEPVMKGLHQWMSRRINDDPKNPQVVPVERIEPNSALGKAVRYLLTHWKELTLFLRHPGAPLDNNVVERALKRAVLHRKNALFYKTLNGAQVGDLFMGIIHTCQLNDVNPFDYLVELQRHALEVQANPHLWFPWNYKDQLRPSPD